MKLIEFEILLNGEVKMEVKGVVGHECQAMTAPFERALGGEAKSTPKPELHQQATQGQQVGAG